VRLSAASLEPRERDPFLRACAAELAKYPEIGPGIIGRVCCRIQREHLNPPSLRGVGGKYR
jgi:hypothetical protein